MLAETPFLYKFQISWRLRFYVKFQFISHVTVGILLQNKIISSEAI